MGDDAKPVVAFLGPKASYTHQATVSSFPETKYTVQPQTSIEDVFAAVQSGTAAHGVVPFENSSNGSVVFTLDLFADLKGLYPDILVEGEIYLPVRHCLLGHTQTNSSSGGSPTKRTDLPWRRLQTTDTPSVSGVVTPTKAVPVPGQPKTKPSYDIAHIKKLYSHPQAWGQCHLFLSTYLKHAERQDVSSTSKAAELVAQDTSGTSAAISSKIAAEMNGLDVLAEGIEDVEGNSTRFFILRSAKNAPTPSLTTSPDTHSASHYKTLISFTVSHTSPGALADSLAVFKTHGLNLTSINTRPSGEGPWNYIFFVEVQGRKEEGDGGKVNEALRELGRVCRGWRWLGSWENKLGGVGK